MNTDELLRADALEAEAKRLRQKAFSERPLPDRWRVGQRVRFLRSAAWAWTAGEEAVISGLRDPSVNKPAAEYQVFYTKPDVGQACWWTTPDDVELAEDVSAALRTSAQVEHPTSDDTADYSLP